MIPLTFEAIAIIASLAYGVMWYQNPNGSYEPLFAMSGFVFVLTEFYRRHKKKNQGANHQNILKKFFLLAIRKKITIGINNEVITDNKTIEDLIQDIALDKHYSIKVVHFLSKNLKQKSNKEKNSEYKYIYEKKAKYIDEKLHFIDEGIQILGYLYKNNFYQLPVSKYALVFKYFVNTVFSGGGMSDSSQIKFDIYIDTKDGETISIPIYLTHEEAESLKKKFDYEHLQLFTIQHVHSASELPYDVIYKKVLPTQIYYGLSFYKKYKDEDWFWGISLWSFGLG